MAVTAHGDKQARCVVFLAERDASFGARAKANLRTAAFTRYGDAQQYVKNAENAGGAERYRQHSLAVLVGWRLGRRRLHDSVLSAVAIVVLGSVDHIDTQNNREFLL